MYQRLIQKALLAASLCLLTATPLWAAEPIDLIWKRANPQQRLRVEQAVDTYRLLDVYPDKTFRGQRAFTRYELADAMARLQGYLHQKHRVPVQVEPRMAAALQIYVQPTGDIPSRHWALPAILQNLSTGVMQAPQRQLQFQGLQSVSHQDLALTLYRLLDWLQVLPTQGARAVDITGQDALTALHALSLLPSDSERNPRGTASRYDLAIALVNTLHHLDEVAKTHPLVPRVVVPTLPPVPEDAVPRRFDGRRAPVYYLPWRPVANP